MRIWSVINNNCWRSAYFRFFIVYTNDSKLIWITILNCWILMELKRLDLRTTSLLRVSWAAILTRLYRKRADNKNINTILQTRNWCLQVSFITSLKNYSQPFVHEQVQLFHEFLVQERLVRIVWNLSNISVFYNSIIRARACVNNYVYDL